MTSYVFGYDQKWVKRVPVNRTTTSFEMEQRLLCPGTV